MMDTQREAVAITTRPLSARDFTRIAALHDRVFGPGRLARTAYRIREAAPPPSGRFGLGTFEGSTLVAAVQITAITVGDAPGAVLLGPLAVDPGHAGRGLGLGLLGEALDGAGEAGIRLVLLVGDAPYYARAGFHPVPPGQITLPGPVDPARLLAAELIPDALALYRGMVQADRS